VAPLSNEGNRDELPSFEALYERYGSRVLNLIYRMTGNEDTSRDLAQDVWLQVYRHLERFEARADIFTWIYRIAVNRTLNHLKQEKRRRWVRLLDQSVGEALSEEAVEPAVALRSSAEGQDRTEERAQHLWRAIQALDLKYRAPLVLFHYEGQSYQQIAETLGLSMTATQARIFRARKQLARILGPLLGEL
jgi:RNA polymerase sigma-70 factor (ECF subfamily)